MTYGDFKDLTRRTVDKILRDKAFDIAKSPKYDRYQKMDIKGYLASIVYKVFDKKSACGAVKNEIMQNEELAEELHKPFIRKCEERKVHSSFINNIWGADPADVQLKSKFNRGFRLLLCVIDIYGKYS